MIRPICPYCKRLSVVTNSHCRHGIRVKVFGCVRCRDYALGKDIVPATAPRTRTVIGKYLRDSSGRFAAGR